MVLPGKITAQGWALAPIAEATTTETVYRKQIRPVVIGGTEVMDSLFPRRDADA
jgi:hypothetical protein